MKPILLIITLILTSLSLQAQTDFPAMKQQFLDYRRADNQDSALYIARKMNQLALKEQSDTSYWYALSMRYQGNPHDTWGNTDSTIYYWSRSVALFKKHHPESSDYATSLDNLGGLYSDIGDYKAAEPFYKQALEIYKKALGEEHPAYANGLMSVGILYSDMWDYKAAEPYFKQSLEIYKKALGEENPYYAMSLNNLGILYSDMGNYKAAEPFLKQASEIYKKTIGEEHPDYLNNLGILYSDMGDYKAAEPYFKQSLEIYKKASGEEHPDYAMSLNNLGILYIRMGDYKAAEPFYKQALEIYKKALGEEHPDYAMSLNNLGMLYIRMGDYKAAEPHYGASYSVKINKLSTNFSWLSIEEKEAYWAQEKAFYQDLNTFASKASVEVPSSTTLSYNGSLVAKSLLLETSRELDQAIAQSSDEEMKTQFLEMKQLRKLYSKMQSEGSTNREVMERNKIQADSLDKILVNKLGEYAASKRKFEITWKDVQSNLSPTEAAIEFAKYFDDKDSVDKYMALVVRPDYKYPKLALLGEEENIGELIQNQAFEALYPMVWEPIEKHLSGVNRIYYSPAGQLNNLSFSALCMGERKDLSEQEKDSIIARGEILTESTSSFECEYLMDRYELHQLTTTRYIADGTLDKQTTMNTSIVLGGGINYDTVPKAHSENKEEDNTEYIFAMNLQQEQEKAKENTERSSKNTSKMEYLEGTKKEVDQVAALFQNKNWSLSAYTDTKAEEGKFKEEVEKNKAGIIHIATHGFAFPDVKKNKRQQQLMGTEEISYRASEDPMVRCGLMFSGSNVSWTGNPQKMIEETGEDGILTALEVSIMNLRKTKLVVLSACETGLGKIEGSEGTFGLKRGFKLAGVEQIIVSLWSVPDKETMELMTIFYEDLTQSLNPVKSFEKAQKQMRESYPTRPNLWAGFVLVR
jgi:tetratricopeptide (TPR) repeat protein